MNNKKRIFLGGTCNDSTWRNNLIKKLDKDLFTYFNPVVPDWTEECYEIEMKEKEQDDYLVFVITPRMTGVYSIAEVVDYSNKAPERVIFCVLENDIDDDGNEIKFDKPQLKSLGKTSELIKSNGGACAKDIDGIIDILNIYSMIDKK